jgi:ribose 5-phosphate isomerase A
MATVAERQQGIFVVNDEKRRAAQAAADEIQSGMVIGLGTGSTVAELIPILAARVRGGLSVIAVATSDATEAAARLAGIVVVPFEDRSLVDLTIDGVDEIDDTLRAIKGAGGALLREKIVATASRRMIAIADGSKYNAAIGSRMVPVEVLPFARAFVMAALEALGAKPTLRMVAGQVAHSDQGNLLVDCAFAGLADPAATALQLSTVPGLLGHGLFLTEIDAAYIARGEHVTRYERR